MADSSVSGISGLTYVKSPESSSDAGGITVNTETFLKLLVAQMQYQDPLEPQSNADFIAQLAQMSSLTEMQSMNSTMGTTKALDYVGKEVYASVLNSQTGVTEIYDGIVTGVTMKNGEAYVIMGKYAICVDDITAIAEVTQTETPAETDAAEETGETTETDAEDLETQSA
jgi:flagellar basal-body rod modification protein FlgD